MEDEDNVGRADCTPSLSLSLSISLSLTLPLSVAIPVPRCACGGAARRRGPAAGMHGKSKGVQSMGATGKMFEGTSYDFAESCADAVWKTMCSFAQGERAAWTGSSTISKLWRSSTADGEALYLMSNVAVAVLPNVAVAA